MKKFFKEYKFIILSFLILLSWGLYEIYSSFKMYPYLLESNDLLLLVDGMIYDTNLHNLQMIGPLFIIIPTVLTFNRYLHTGYIKNLLMRDKYKNIITKLYLKCLLCSLIFPAFIIILYFVCGIITNNFNIIVDSTVYLEISSISGSYISNIGLFMFIYLLNLMLHSILYINIAIIFCKKYSNVFISIILGYLGYIFLELIIEVPIAVFVVRVLGIKNLIYDFSLSTVWIYNLQTISLTTFTIYSFILVCLSCIVVYLVYKNKEGVINAIEREN